MSLIERVVLAVGIALRLYLTVVNAEANDDHLTVIRIIADEHRLPRLNDAWEGFQPKLYHAVVALLWKLSPLQSLSVRIRLAQLVACAAGIATLFVVHHGLRHRNLTARVRVLALALVALNPTLIGLNAQATNDSLVILCATVALASGCDFFRTGSRTAFAAMSAGVVLAILSKGNGLVLFCAVIATFCLATLHSQAIPSWSRMRLLRFGGAFAVVCVAFAAMFGPYRANWQDTGNPFAINGPPASLPHFVTPTYVARPGITSVVDGFLTFRLVDMLVHPYITNDPLVYPRHRTSLWSQLYGRAHIAHFAQHPPSWRSTSGLVTGVSRLILILALVPSALFFAEVFRNLMDLLRRPFRAGAPGQIDTDLLTMATVGFLAFGIFYSLVYRDFSTMKAEFLFPALLAYVFFTADGLERSTRVLSRGWATGLCYAVTCLLVLYVIDAVILAVQLT